MSFLGILSFILCLCVELVFAWRGYISRIPFGNQVPSPCNNGTWEAIGHLCPGGGGHPACIKVGNFGNISRPYLNPFGEVRIKREVQCNTIKILY